MARFSLLRFRKRPAEDAPEGGPATPQRAGRVPPPGALRRERRALVRTREERIRDLGGLMLEMYRRDQFKQDLSDRAVSGGARGRGAIAGDRRAPRGLGRTAARRRRPSVHLRRPDPVGLALLRQLRAPGRRGARRLVHQLRQRPSGRRTVLRELRHLRPGRKRRRQWPGRCTNDVPAAGPVGRSLGETGASPSATCRPWPAITRRQSPPSLSPILHSVLA